MAKCPVFNVADLVGKKWTIVAMQEVALNGDKGFNAIYGRMGKISPKILSRRLKDLEAKGIIAKKIISDEIPVKTRYWLTEKGKALQEVVGALREWTIKYNEEKFECNGECVKCSLY